MAITVKGGYKCGYCGKFFTNPVDADACKDTHNLVYVAISREDLSRLVSFIYSKEESLLTETLVENLQKYLKGSFILEKIRK